jgi:hypothetical protein
VQECIIRSRRERALEHRDGFAGPAFEHCRDRGKAQHFGMVLCERQCASDQRCGAHGIATVEVDTCLIEKPRDLG